MIRLWLILFHLLFIFIPSSSAATLYLKSGKTVAGDILTKTEEYVEVDRGIKAIEYFLKAIESPIPN